MINAHHEQQKAPPAIAEQHYDCFVRAGDHARDSGAWPANRVVAMDDEHDMTSDSYECISDMMRDIGFHFPNMSIYGVMGSLASSIIRGSNAPPSNVLTNACDLAMRLVSVRDVELPGDIYDRLQEEPKKLGQGIRVRDVSAIKGSHGRIVRSIGDYLSEKDNAPWFIDQMRGTNVVASRVTALYTTPEQHLERAVHSCEYVRDVPVLQHAKDYIEAKKPKK